MAKVIVTDTHLKNIGDAIREKEGSTDLIPLTEMSDRIKSLPFDLKESTSDANATANTIREGYTAYVDGEKITGTIPTVYLPKPTISFNTDSGVITSECSIESGWTGNNTTEKSQTRNLDTYAGQTITPGTTNYTIPKYRWLTGKITIAGDADLAAYNIKKGVTIFGVEGTYDVGHDTSDATATANDILAGKTAYISSGKVSGKILTRTSDSLSASGKTVTVPNGYYASTCTIDVSVATQATPSITINSSGLITASSTQVSGYVESGTTKKTKQLTTQAATTWTPTTTDQTIPASTYLTGDQIIKGDYNLDPQFIRSGVSIFGVTGTYTGSGGSAYIDYSYPTAIIDEPIEIDVNGALAFCINLSSDSLTEDSSHYMIQCNFYNSSDTFLTQISSTISEMQNGASIIYMGGYIASGSDNTSGCGFYRDVSYIECTLCCQYTVSSDEVELELMVIR
jgi:hypothetical protein